MAKRLFKDLLSAVLEADLERLNPWWRGLPQPQLPPVRRWAFPVAMRRLQNGLTKVTVLRGPRQVGKSTLIRQMVEKENLRCQVHLSGHPQSQCGSRNASYSTWGCCGPAIP